MRDDNLFDSIKTNLNGRPGQPIVFGVCKALAARFGTEPWVFRGLAIVIGVFWSIAALVVYTVIGFAMPETSERTQGVFRGLFISLNEVAEKLIETVRRAFGGPSERRGA